jgi:hypothetical protein
MEPTCPCPVRRIPPLSLSGTDGCPVPVHEERYQNSRELSLPSVSGGSFPFSGKNFQPGAVGGPHWLEPFIFRIEAAQAFVSRLHQGSDTSQQELIQSPPGIARLQRCMPAYLRPLSAQTISIKNGQVSDVAGRGTQIAFKAMGTGSRRGVFDG